MNSLIVRAIVTHLLNHLAAGVGVVLIVATIAFAATQMLPGDLALRVAEARYGDTITFASADEFRQKGGFDRSVLVQYAHWMGSLLRGDLGHSLVTEQPVVAELRRSIGATWKIAISGLCLALILSVLIGVSAGWSVGSAVDRCFLTLSAVLSSSPPFLIGIGLITVFAIRLQWLPAAGNDQRGSFILPSLTLAITLIPDLSRIARNAVARTRREFYVTYGRLKGRSWARIILVHALRPTLVPIIAYLGPLAAHVIGGIIVIDVLFNLGGLGIELIDSIQAADIPMVLGAGLAIGVFVVTVSGLTDLIVILLDPRQVRSR